MGAFDRTFNKSFARSDSQSSVSCEKAREAPFNYATNAFCVLSEFMEVMTGGDD